MEKQTYVTPSIEIIEIENEGSVMTTSGSVPGFNPGGGVGLRSGRSRTNHASVSELEDLINDILTIKK